MSALPAAISEDPPAPRGSDYAALRAEAIRLVHAMCDEWTDVNYSDPGVTILEQLCYALTELPYRAALPVQDLLCAPQTGRVHLRRQALMPAWEMLPCNPVTANDLRRIVLDRVPGVANVWFQPREQPENGGLFGLYDILVLPRADLTDRDDGCCGEDALRERVLRCYLGHRALCEDAESVRVLEMVETVVHADVEIGEDADPAETLAQVLFNLGLFLAPEPRRSSLAGRCGDDEVAADVFAGPLMHHGLIAEDQLGPLPSSVTVMQVRQVLAEVPGVSAVDRLSVQVSGHERRFGPHDALPHKPDTLFWLNAMTGSGHVSIHLHRHNLHVAANPARARRLLDQLWREHRRVYDLRQEYAERYGPPPSTYRDLSGYTSVQTQFPNIYGINAGGLPVDASPARHGKAKQLKGYLMPFDQLLADNLSQLAFLRDLFSVRAGGKSTYAQQSLRGAEPDLGALLGPGYEVGLERLRKGFDPVDARRNAILDLLLSLYAQGARAAVTADGADGADRRRSHIRAKQALLRHVAPLSRNRGRGLDCRRPHSPRGMSGVEALCRVQLRLLDAPSRQDWARPRADRGGDRVWTAAEDPGEAFFGKRLPDEIWPTIERHFKPVRPFDLGPETQGAGDGDESPLAGRHVAAPLAEALADPSRYRIGRIEGPLTIYVVAVDREGGWWWLGEHLDETEAIEAIRRLLRHSAEDPQEDDPPRLYIVEWILLRAAMDAEAEDGGRYNFRISAVLSARGRERSDATWRRQAEVIVRENTPAHVALDCLFLRPRAMRHFERLYAKWTEALQHCRRGPLAEASRALAGFLTLHGPTTAPSPSPPPAPGAPPTSRREPISPPAPATGPAPATPDPTTGPTPGPAPKPIPEAIRGPRTDVRSEPEPEPETERGAHREPHAGAEPEPAPEPEPEPDPEREPDPDRETVPAPEPAAEPEPEPERAILESSGGPWARIIRPALFLISRWRRFRGDATTKPTSSASVAAHPLLPPPGPSPDPASQAVIEAAPPAAKGLDAVRADRRGNAPPRPRRG